MNGKSDTCFGKDGKPLSEYDSREAAIEAAEYCRMRYGRTMHPYACEKCGRWHLSPVPRIATGACGCVDKTGTAKCLYFSRRDADVMAGRLRGRDRVELRIYPCPLKGGWHLTSSGGEL